MYLYCTTIFNILVGTRVIFRTSWLFVTKEFSKILQNLQKNACAVVSFP